MTDLGERLTHLRERRGWTKTYVANKLGIKTLSTYANYEYGLREPDKDTLVQIADLYDVSMDYLLGREERNFQITIDPEFEAWLNDPRASKLYKEFNESDEERREMLFAMWEVIKSQKKK